MPIFILYSHFSLDPEQLPCALIPLLVSCSRHIKESVGNLWLSLRPVCELQGKVTESELRHKEKSYR